MLATSNAFKDIMSRGGIQPVYVLEIHLDESTVYYFSTEFIELPDLAVPIYPNLSDVVGVSSSIDIQSRSVSIGEIHAHFADDGVIRNIVKDNFVYGKKAVLKLGCTDFTAYTDYIDVAVGVTRDILPTEGEISIECADMLTLLRNKTIGPRYWLNGHPLEVIQDILNAAGMAASTYDASTLDWSTDSERQHFLVSRYDARVWDFAGSFISNGVNDAGEDAGSLINELCELMWGSFAPDEDGVFRFKMYHADGAVARDLSKDDTGNVQQLSAAAPLLNSISMNVSEQTRKSGRASWDNSTEWGEKRISDVTIGFTKKDLVSAAYHNFLGNESSENDMTVSTSWLAGPSRIGRGMKVDSADGVLKVDVPSNINRAVPGTSIGSAQLLTVLADADAVILNDAAYNGFCGSKFDLGTIPAGSRAGQQQYSPHTFPVQYNRDVHTDRPVYLLLEGLAYQWVDMATVKTQPTINDTTIEVENVNVGFTINQLIVFGSDNGPLVAGVRVGYRVTSWNASTGDLGINPGILTTLAVGVPVMEICGPTTPNTDLMQWQREIVKCVDAYAYWYGADPVPPSVGPSAKYYPHHSLNAFPGGDGSLGPWSTKGQPLPKSLDLAITCIGNNPTGAIEGDNYEWPYATLYNNRYPNRVVYRFEGTSGAIGTNHFGEPGMGSPPSGRSQFGTTSPWGWVLGTPDTREDALDEDDGPPVPEGPGEIYHTLAWDITILVDSVSRRLDRFSNGCPKLSIKTPLRHADLQLGDFITIDTDVYSAYGRSGTDTNVVFEITSKTVDALADDPGCSFELAWVRDSGTAYPAPQYSWAPYVAQKTYPLSVTQEIFTDVAGTTQQVLNNSGQMVTK